MATVERICPKCGTSNSSDRARCQRCGANLTHLPAPRQSNLPNKVEGAALVLGAGAFIARVGWRLLTRQVLPRVMANLAERQKVITPDERPRRSDVTAPENRAATEESPDYVIRGWRTWSIHQGDERSKGSESFEWRVSRRREGGAGKE